MKANVGIVHLSHKLSLCPLLVFSFETMCAQANAKTRIIIFR